VLVSHDVQRAIAESDVVLRLRRGRPVSGDEELYR
jgi:ABC-type sulfate/molybdate transport systems ATPase subunit